MMVWRDSIAKWWNSNTSNRKCLSMSYLGAPLNYKMVLGPEVLKKGRPIRLKYLLKWKYEMQKIIPKLGKAPHVCVFYRPIVLLSSISKLFEKLLHPIIQSKNLIPNHQYGFVHNHSSTDSIIQLQTS